MLQNVRISSKGQITIPAVFYKSLGFAKGDTLVAMQDGNQLILKKAKIVLDEAVGAVKVPEKYAHLSIEHMIQKAKKEYMKRRSI